MQCACAVLCCHLWPVRFHCIFPYVLVNADHGLRRVSAAARLLGTRVRIPAVAWISVCCECCVLSGSGLCDGPIPRPEEPYHVCVCVGVGVCVCAIGCGQVLQ